MSTFMRLRGRHALITGAGNGIGAALAMLLARRGCHLALADISADGLEQTREAILAGSGSDASRISLHQLDVGDPGQVAALPGIVSQTHERLDLLVNNAGVALGGRFEQLSEADFDWLMAINFSGVVRMTRAFLPMLHESDEARLVNLSSLYGLVSPAGQTAYSASKFAVRGFSNALAQELAGSTVGVSVVHPGGIRTGINRRARLASGVDPAEAAQHQARFEKLLRMPPSEAAAIIVHGIERRRSRILVGSDAKIVSALERLLPVLHSTIIARISR